MANRLQRAQIIVFCAYIAFVVAGLSFGKMTEYDDFAEATRDFPLIGAAFTTLVVGAYVALAAVLIGGLPIALAAARNALAARRWRILALLAVPALAFLFFFGYTLLLVQVIAPALHSGSGPTPKNVGLGISLVVVLLLAAVASTAAVATAIAGSEISPRLYRFARVPAALAALAMAVVTLALLTWGLSLRADVPDLFNANDGFLASSTAANWLAPLAVMGVATGSALVAAIRSFAASPVAHEVAVAAG
jgi:hypothetical protein